MKRPKPSLFAIVSLLMLLGLGVWANHHIAHRFKPIASYIHVLFANYSLAPSKPVRPPTIPEELLDRFGTPTRASQQSFNTFRFIYTQWDAPSNRAGGAARLYEFRFGVPFSVRSSRIAHANMFNDLPVWPEDGQRTKPPATIYHPLGLIVNPIVYAMPPWIVLLLARRKVVRVLHRRRQRRLELGLCDHCDYEVKDLPTCPECGHATP